MKRQFSGIIFFACILMLCGPAFGQTGTLDHDLNIVTRIAYDGMEFEVQLDYDRDVSDGSGHYWKFKGIKPVELTNSLDMTFRLIPAGTFIMGSPAHEPGRDTDEILHEVRLTKPFYMQTTEVTQGQWNVVMGTDPSYYSSCGGSCPVEQVSWENVQDFITAINALGIGTYRLPTEAEWEYAARAGSTTAFANGPIKETGPDDDPILDAMGWYVYNSENTPHPVAQKQPNGWGLYDMHGNVWEWCQDWYEEVYESTGTTVKKKAPVTDPTGPSAGSYRVNRGGSCIGSARYCRSANRDRFNPENRRFNLGFRLARDN